MESIRELELDDNVLNNLANEVSTLSQKLPHEIRTGEDRYDPADTIVLKDTLEDIKELLVNKLLSTEQGS